MIEVEKFTTLNLNNVKVIASMINVGFGRVGKTSALNFNQYKSLRGG